MATSFHAAADPILDLPNLCPHCGADLSVAKEDGVVRGSYMFRPGDGLYVDGVRLRCSQRVHDVIGLIFMATPNIVSKEAIATRFPYTGDLPVRLINVYLSQARAAARSLGKELPIKTIIRRGVSWADRPSPADSRPGSLFQPSDAARQ